MKNIVRAFVVVLVLTGAAATTLTPSASAAQHKVTPTRTSMIPVPTCAPSDPNACGMLGRD
jgi:hypothetical protein